MVRLQGCYREYLLGNKTSSKETLQNTIFVGDGILGQYISNHI